MEIVDTSGELFKKGLNLFKRYNDKNWSLTDCISFSFMKEKNMKQAFTNDHHFIQAGFEKLL
jgi:predicted nucleic acid-binding protein